MPKKYNKEILQRAYDLITIEKYSANKAAKELGIDCGTMRKRLKEYFDLTFLPDGKKKINSNYFSIIDSEEKAYWLGFLTADGYVKGTGAIEVGLAEIDVEHLNKLKASLGSEHKISRKETKLTASDKVYVSYKLSFKDKIMTNDLIRYGLTPNKSYDAYIPAEIINSKYVKHYIRGLFDGDGSLYSYKQANGKKRYEISIVSGSKEMIDNITDVIRNNLKIDMKYRLSRNLHEVRLYDQFQIKLFLDWIYSNSTIYLDRKYNKATAVLE
jgi:hypothetical protein